MSIGKVLGTALIASAFLGACNQNSGERPQPQRSIEDVRGEAPEGQSAPAEKQQSTTSGEADAYGRMPGDPHYGHDHPPEDQQQNTTTQPGSPIQQQTPQSGEPDQYGRMPGHAHYGHDHPPLDEEQKQGTTQQGSPVQQQAPAEGQPDQYGRMPGDAHYGHNHPPEDGQ